MRRKFTDELAEERNVMDESSIEAVLRILVGIAIAAVAAVLATGIVAFIAGGEFNRKYGNKLMRLRVATQAVAVVLLLALLILKGIAK